MPRRTAGCVIAVAAWLLLAAPSSAFEQRLMASDGEGGADFSAVAVAGGLAVVGAPGADVGASDDQGAVYVFARRGDAWVQTAKLTATDGDAGDRLGVSVAIDGETIVAGAPFADVDDELDRGAVYTFAATGPAARTQTARLTASDGDANENLGFSVAVDGGAIVAGAPGPLADGPGGPGAAYTFASAGPAERTQTATLLASGLPGSGNLGYSVAVDSGTVVAGAPTTVVGGDVERGQVYTFAAAGPAVRTQTARLTASDGDEHTRLGNSVAVDGQTIVAGAPHAGVDGQGGLYTFVATGAAELTETARLTAGDGAADDLGWSVAADGQTIVAGAPTTTVGEATSQGAVYAFAAAGAAERTQTARLVASGGSRSEQFGESVAVDGQTVIAGAPFRRGRWIRGGLLRADPGAAASASSHASAPASAGRRHDAPGAVAAVVVAWPVPGWSACDAARRGGAAAPSPAGATGHPGALSAVGGRDRGARDPASPAGPPRPRRWPAALCGADARSGPPPRPQVHAPPHRRAAAPRRAGGPERIPLQRPGWPAGAASRALPAGRARDRPGGQPLAPRQARIPDRPPPCERRHVRPDQPRSAHRRRAGAAVVGLAVGALLSASVPAISGAARTELVSTKGFLAAGHSPSISTTGRRTAFTSGRHLVVHDRRSNRTRRVSVSSRGTAGNRLSGRPAISGDGRYVAFESSVSNLVRGDRNGFSDVFVHDLRRGRTRLVSVSSGGDQGDDQSTSPSISADGRFVAFISRASNLVAGDSRSSPDVFAHDLRTRTTAAVNVRSNETQPAQGQEGPVAISANGRFVAFATSALLPTTHPDVYAHDRRTGETRRVSDIPRPPEDPFPSPVAAYPSISASGRVVAFWSRSHPSGRPCARRGQGCVFVRDMRTGRVQLVSVGLRDRLANDISTEPAISGNGRFVAFSSEATNLVQRKHESTGTRRVYRYGPLG